MPFQQLTAVLVCAAALCGSGEWRVGPSLQACFRPPAASRRRGHAPV